MSEVRCDVGSLAIDGCTDANIDGVEGRIDGLGLVGIARSSYGLIEDSNALSDQLVVHDGATSTHQLEPQEAAHAGVLGVAVVGGLKQPEHYFWKDARRSGSGSRRSLALTFCVYRSCCACSSASTWNRAFCDIMLKARVDHEARLSAYEKLRTKPMPSKPFVMQTISLGIAYERAFLTWLEQLPLADSAGRATEPAGRRKQRKRARG